MEKLKTELTTYLPNTRKAKSQPAKEILFASFAERVFGIKPEEFAEKMETPVASKLWVVRGRIDAVFGNLIIEFKVDLDRELDDAKDELKKYFQSLKEKHPRATYVGIATDGIVFRVFKPVFDKNGEVSKISEIDSLDLEKEPNAEKIYLWFDSYLYLSEKIAPTTEDLRRRFGVDSPTFAYVRDELKSMLEAASKDPTVKTKLENWDKYLEIVYGDKLTSEDLFIKHTYLATLAKVMVYLRLYEGKIPSKSQAVSLLDGRVFADYGITNFIEEDFFAWVLNSDVLQRTSDLVVGLLRQVIVYDLDQINEDVFKELYQELVDPEVRHDLGEYYTPDWLAEYAIKKLIQDTPSASILDPACGSGTFLFTAIRLTIHELEKEGWKQEKILTHILNNVMGVDIHPLAVIISRTNYLLALRRLLASRSGSVSIPVYLSDSIKLPEFVSEVRYGLPVYRIGAVGKTFFAIPKSLADKPSVIDEVIGRMYEYAKEYERGEKTRDPLLRAFYNYLKGVGQIGTNEAKILETDLGVLLDLIDKKANSIWTFILRNIYRPVALSLRKFDVVVGNPPWLALHFMKNPQYQEFLKEQSIVYGLVDKGSTHLFTHMEMATLFLVKSIDLYVKNGGFLAFVMPKSILVSSQHAKFRRFEKVNATLRRVVDLENVRPVFNVPSCVVELKKE